MIGVHAPEFERERDPQNVRREAARLGVTWPIVLDNDFAIWEALGNRYWPTVYLIDRRGSLRYAHAGETHANTPEAADVEAGIARLLEEPSP